MQSKILTADKLVVRNWPCDTNCALCDQVFETAAHLCLHCPFARHVWHLISTWTAGVIQVPTNQDEGVEAWWNRSMEHLNQAQKHSVAAILSYTTWNIWKERNRRVFQHKSLQPHQVVLLSFDQGGNQSEEGGLWHTRGVLSFIMFTSSC